MWCMTLKIQVLVNLTNFLSNKNIKKLYEYINDKKNEINVNAYWSFHLKLKLKWFNDTSGW